MNEHCSVVDKQPAFIDYFTPNSFAIQQPHPPMSLCRSNDWRHEEVVVTLHPVTTELDDNAIELFMSRSQGFTL
jgi:hypothetical protein